MSVHVWSWVLTHSPATKNDRLVLLSLSDHAHKNGEGAAPSVALMAHEARCSKRAAQYSLERLLDAGCVEWTGRWKRWDNGSSTKEYRVLMTEAAAAAVFPKHKGGAKRTRPATGATVAPRNHRVDGVQPVSPGGATRPGNVSMVAPEPSTRTVQRIQPEPPSHALARVREDGEAGPPTITIEKGASPRTAARLQRTASRTGARLVDQRSSR